MTREEPAVKTRATVGVSRCRADTVRRGARIYLNTPSKRLQLGGTHTRQLDKRPCEVGGVRKSRVYRGARRRRAGQHRPGRSQESLMHDVLAERNAELLGEQMEKPTFGKAGIAGKLTRMKPP